MIDVRLKIKAQQPSYVELGLHIILSLLVPILISCILFEFRDKSMKNTMYIIARRFAYIIFKGSTEGTYI